MNYLAPPAPHNASNKNSSRRSGNSPRLTSRSVSPCRYRSRANSLTPTQQDSSSPSSPQPLRRRPPCSSTSQLNDICRPRCNTDPSNSNSSTNIKKSTATRSVLGSLLRQTLKVTSASVGFSASEER
ncbi:GH24185 [Drosophila grimshawi]|uniref:GH24185 n=1 Tax=Drosophila grimshawi TaxID=7222 RepID=B4JN86_DROGR|nr:GH24185 [Drosophila grimshawi]